MMSLANPLLRVSLVAITCSVSFLATLTVKVVSGVRSESDPILVSLNQEGIPKSIDIDLQWGGFYARKNDGRYSVFRLLDIDSNQFHITTYERLFDELPGLNDVSFLVPDNEHVVGKAVDILDFEPIFVGAKGLYPDDVEKFRNYLGRQKNGGSTAIRTLGRIITSSREIPVKTRLSNHNGVLKFEETTIQ